MLRMRRPGRKGGNPGWGGSPFCLLSSDPFYKCTHTPYALTPHAHTQIYTHTMHTDTHTSCTYTMQTHAYIYMCMCIHAFTRHAYTSTHKNIHPACMYTHHVCMHKYTPCMHTYIHTYAHIDIHTYTCNHHH